jgi:four helix bundle protein
MTANSKQQTAKPDPFAGAYTFRQLAMWKRAQELASDVIDIASALPESRSNWIIANQIIRASSSIAANIAEGHGRFSAGAYRNHLSISRGSTAETISWIDLLARRGLISGEHEGVALTKCAELMKMITAAMAGIDRRQVSSKRVGDERAEYDYE